MSEESGQWLENVDQTHLVLARTTVLASTTKKIKISKTHTYALDSKALDLKLMQKFYFIAFLPEFLQRNVICLQDQDAPGGVYVERCPRGHHLRW